MATSGCGAAEVDVRRLEDEGHAAGVEGCCGLHGKAEIGKELLHVVAAHAEDRWRQRAAGTVRSRRQACGRRGSGWRA